MKSTTPKAGSVGPSIRVTVDRGERLCTSSCKKSEGETRSNCVVPDEDEEGIRLPKTEGLLERTKEREEWVMIQERVRGEKEREERKGRGKPSMNDWCEVFFESGEETRSEVCHMYIGARVRLGEMSGRPRCAP